MRTVENSKVVLTEKAEYYIYDEEKYSYYQQSKMQSSTKSEDGNQFDAEEVGKRPDSPPTYDGMIFTKGYKNEIFRLSDETIESEAKTLLSDSGCFSPDSEEDETSLDSDNGTRSEGTTDPDSEVQDERDLDDTDSRTSMVHKDYDFSVSTHYDSEECSSGDSCEMTYIELDLSSESQDDISEVVDLMIKNLRIDPNQISFHSDNLDSSDTTLVNISDDRFEEITDGTPDVGKIPGKQDSDLPRNEVKGDSPTDPIVISDDEEVVSSTSKRELQAGSLGSFLPLSASNLFCSLPEETYFQIAAHLLDDRTEMKLDIEGDPSDPDSSGCTLNSTDIPSEMESSNSGNPKRLLDPDETNIEEIGTCPMTFVDLDLNEQFDNLNIAEDKTPLCRGNPLDQNEIQTPPQCSEIDITDFEVHTPNLIHDPPFLIDAVADAGMDLTSSLVSPIPEFYSSQMFPSFCSEFNFDSNVSLPSISSDCNTKTCSEQFKAVEEMPPSITSAPRSSVLPPPSASSIQYSDNSSFGVSFFDDNFENEDTYYENEYVTKNLHKLEEIDAILGLSNPEITRTGPSHFSNTSLSPPSPFASNNFPPLYSRQTCVSSMTPIQTSTPVTRQSSNNNVVTRVTTQTPSTQSEALPAFPGGILVVLSTSSIQGLKRPTCIEMPEPAKKPFNFDNYNNLSSSEADFRKKAKQEVANLTDQQILEFDNNKESLLHRSVRTGNTEYVLSLLKRLKNFDSQGQQILNAENNNLQTPLHLAVEENIPAIVYQLINDGAEVNHLAMTSSNRLEAPLHFVASRGNQLRLVLKRLLEANDLDIDIRNSEGQTALHCAAWAHRKTSTSCHTSIDSDYAIKKILARGANPLSQDNIGKNVLMYAIESKDLNLVSHIMKTVSKEQNEEMLTATTTTGQTCLSLAHDLKDQFTQTGEWEKLISILIRHMSSN